MYRVLPLILLLLSSSMALAAEAATPSGLSPEAAAQGWILLFDGTSTFGWSIDGEATVTEGKLRLGGSKPTRATTITAFQSFALDLESTTSGNDQAAAPKLLFATGLITLRNTAARSIHRELSAPHSAAPLVLEVPAGQTLTITRLAIKPTGLKSIFNSKDLTGWKRFTEDPKRAKSVFEVTPQGEIGIKNGPGDLQTEEQWADFILQAECKTNGKYLNSGIFFRCLPGQYQQGYEAQIQNDFSVMPPKDYVVEEFDPQTHQLKDKRKVQSPAKDYGTGAIYRRVPARDVGAKDNEWFTMTILAQGRHLATWVNGIQAVDWTDNRPLNTNARNGCRLDKGAISLQGHDPTTDLLFRNFRIAELAGAKP